MPTDNSKVSYKYGTQSEYNSLGSKDTNAIYFLTDTHKICVGNQEYSDSKSYRATFGTETIEGVETDRVFTLYENDDGSETVISQFIIPGGTSTATVYFMSEDGETQYSAVTVNSGEDVIYDGDIPTKTQTAQYTYAFDGWSTTLGGEVDSSALENITNNKYVYAHFASTVRTYTVNFYNDNTLLTTDTVAYGSNATYSGNTPTKAQTAQYTYTFDGWSSTNGGSADSTILNNITADKNVYAHFAQSDRLYTVRFYNDTTLLQTTQATYGSDASYTGSTPTGDGDFIGWEPVPTNITADTDCYAQFESPYITDSWETISARSSAGTAQNYYAVGDCKEIQLSGTMGTLALNQKVYVYILGFNHNATLEGSGVTFGGFKDIADLTDTALTDSNYGSSKTDGTKTFNVSHWGNGNYGGWSACDMRYDILGSTDVAPTGYGSAPSASRAGKNPTSTCATSPVANTLMSCLPSDLRAKMKPVTKYTDNTGNSSNTAANVTSTTDYLPLLAEYEVQGTRSYANQYEKDKQLQYAYFAAGNSKIKYKHSDKSVSCYWWVRSPNYDLGNYFCIVSTGGSAGTSYTSYSRGVAPLFLI